MVGSRTERIEKSKNTKMNYTEIGRTDKIQRDRDSTAHPHPQNRGRHHEQCGRASSDTHTQSDQYIERKFIEYTDRGTLTWTVRRWTVLKAKAGEWEKEKAIAFIRGMRYAISTLSDQYRFPTPCLCRGSHRTSHPSHPLQPPAPAQPPTANPKSTAASSD